MLTRLIIAASIVWLTSLHASSIYDFELGGSSGLTSAYVASGCVQPNGPSFHGCIAGSTGTFSEESYAANLFSGVTGISSALPNGNVAGGMTVNDSRGIPFSLVDEASVTNGSTMNYWGASGDTTGQFGTFIVPVGLYNATSVAVMMDNQWGASANVNAFIELDFGTSSNVANAGSLVFGIVNGVDVRAAIDCGAATGACTQFARTLVGGNTANVWTATYTGDTGGAPYGGTSGTLNLDDVLLGVDSAHTGYYLVDVAISDFSGGAGISQTGVSSITVVASPEPSTVWLVALGAVLLCVRNVYPGYRREVRIRSASDSGSRFRSST